LSPAVGDRVGTTSASTPASPRSAESSERTENQRSDTARPESPEGGGTQRTRREPPAPSLTVYPAGSYVVRMDQPYSRMADMMLDTEYYNAHDPRSYDDTGWTLGALRNVKTTRVMDQKILDVKMDKVDGDVSAVKDAAGSGNILVINDTAENPIATLRYALPQAK